MNAFPLVWGIQAMVYWDKYKEMLPCAVMYR
ncbi:hypothetical protein J2Z69_002473 [Paenibacillus shirakamiensis]|uniref:Uncharacterized protein n=1 Tax=Paenibacillus shirakamiensis TaxID=1265935 RepID=A0ABS4JI80_9BACL|nr:hypothetical protein [Paenibacillus shirakamiensis]